MLSITNEVDLLIFCYICFVCDTNLYFSIITLTTNVKPEKRVTGELLDEYHHE